MKKKIEIEIPDGKKAEWVNGVLTLVDDKPIEYKFKVGDQVLCRDGAKYEISGLSKIDEMPVYSVLGFDRHIISEADIVELVPQDITERIKTFDDACKWCKENGKYVLVQQWSAVELKFKNDLTYEQPTDILAYLKLRIITVALNEGWEWEPDKQGFGTITRDVGIGPYFHCTSIDLLVGRALLFRTRKLAEYAAKQFRDIYADFCGCKKGGEE